MFPDREGCHVTVRKSRDVRRSFPRWDGDAESGTVLVVSHRGVPVRCGTRCPREEGRLVASPVSSPLRGRGRLVLARLPGDPGPLGLALLPEFLAACFAPLGDRGVHHPETCPRREPAGNRRCSPWVGDELGHEVGDDALADDAGRAGYLGRLRGLLSVALGGGPVVRCHGLYGMGQP
jgi:hypothetical protein